MLGRGNPTTERVPFGFTSLLKDLEEAGTKKDNDMDTEWISHMDLKEQLT